MVAFRVEEGNDERKGVRYPLRPWDGRSLLVQDIESLSSRRAELPPDAVCPPRPLDIPRGPEPLTFEQSLLALRLRIAHTLGSAGTGSGGRRRPRGGTPRVGVLLAAEVHVAGASRGSRERGEHGGIGGEEGAKGSWTETRLLRAKGEVQTTVRTAVHGVTGESERLGIGGGPLLA